MPAKFARDEDGTMTWHAEANNIDGSMVEWCADCYMTALKEYKPKKIKCGLSCYGATQLYRVTISFDDAADEAEFIVRAAAAGIYPYDQSK
jgi:hypothetical protein